MIRNTPATCSLALLSALILGAALPGQYFTVEGNDSDTNQVARGLKMIPVAEFLFRSPAPRTPPLRSLLRTTEEDRQRLLHGNDFRCLDADQLLDIVRMSSMRNLDEFDIFLRIHGKRLFVGGPKECIQSVEQALRGLHAAMSRKVHLRGRLFELKAGLRFPALAKAEQLPGLVRNLPLLWDARTITRSGQQVVLTQEKFTRYVWDTDVEVAQKSKIGDPKVDTTFEGVRLLVETHSLVGSSDVVLLCQFAIGERRRPFEPLSTGVPELPVLEIPNLAVNTGCFSGRIAPGDALLLSMQGDSTAGSNLLLILEATDTAPGRDASLAAGHTLILPVSALSTPSLMSPLDGTLDDGFTASSGGLVLPHVESNAATGFLQSEHLIALINSTLGLDDEEDSSVTAAGGYLLLKASEQTRAHAKRLLTTLQDQWISTVEVQAHTTLLPVDESRSTFAREATPSNQKTQQYHTLTFPALLGRTHVLVKGMETSTIQDFEVEIAQEASISNPVVSSIFSGVVLNLTPRALVAGTGADLSLDLAHVDKPMRRPTEQKDGGDLYLPRTGRAHFQHQGLLPLGAEMTMGWGPLVVINQQQFRMHQTVTLRKP